jgi:hypothetical protein
MLGDAFVSAMATRAAALQAFESQFFRSLATNLRKAEEFFFRHMSFLRQSIHALISSPDASAARSLKLKLKSIEAFVVLNMNGFDKVSPDGKFRTEAPVAPSSAARRFSASMTRCLGQTPAMSS